ncbi:MAG: HmuY family protein [Bacteroidota bacterium]
MKYIYLLFLSIGLPILAYCQIDQPSLGASYANMNFYSLSDGATTQHDHTIWDIAFGVAPQDLSVFVNEGVGLAMGPPLPEVELYITKSTDYANADTTGMIRIYNNELSWEAGAFNHVSSPSDPFDQGWGTYNPATHQVTGSRVFCIKLRSGSYKFLQIQSLISGVYTFQFKDLDGSNELTKTITKSNYTGKNLAYYSFDSDSAMDLEPAQWDLLFTRYYTPLNAGMGDTVNYMVTGVLINRGMQVARVTGIDPMTVNYMDYEDEYVDTLAIIGHDWKSFNLSTFQWSIPSDRVYFVKTTTDSLWKVQFLDFEGSSTGTSTLERTFETELTAIGTPIPQVSFFKLFPNPSAGMVNVSFEFQTVSKKAHLRLVNQLGQSIYSSTLEVRPGPTTHRLDLTDLASGMYHLSLQVENRVVSQPLVIK